MTLSVAEPGFPRGGSAYPPGGANIRFCQIFPKTAWNWKNLDRGASPLDPPLLIGLQRKFIVVKVCQSHHQNLTWCQLWLSLWRAKWRCNHFSRQNVRHKDQRCRWQKRLRWCKQSLRVLTGGTQCTKLPNTMVRSHCPTPRPSPTQISIKRVEDPMKICVSVGLGTAWTPAHKSMQVVLTNSDSQWLLVPASDQRQCFRTAL